MVVRPAHAVVLGGSIGGLFAALVLAKHFAKVTIVERDELTDTPAPRKGVPQSRLLHTLLARGSTVAEQLMPGLRQSLLSDGAAEFEYGKDTKLHHFGGYKRNFDVGVPILGLTRNFFEMHVRRRVLAVPNIEVLQKVDAMGLVASEDGKSVRQVKVRNRGGTDTAERFLDADLVVDATGRGSHVMRWLQDLGYAPPPETVIKMRCGYAGRIYTAKDDWSSWKLVANYPASSRGTRAGVVMRIEPEAGSTVKRWQVGLCGWWGDYPEGTEAGFSEFARSLPSQEVYEFTQKAEPLTDIEVTKCRTSVRRHFERLSAFPDGFVVLGDAFCALNPIYGQGLSMCAVAASALDDSLQGALKGANGLSGFWRPLYQRLARDFEGAWMLSSAADLSSPAVEEHPTLQSKCVGVFNSMIGRACLTDPEVSRLFVETVNLIAPPQSFLKPTVLWRILRAQL